MPYFPYYWIHYRPAIDIQVLSQLGSKDAFSITSSMDYWITTLLLVPDDKWNEVERKRKSQWVINSAMRCNYGYNINRILFHSIVACISYIELVIFLDLKNDQFCDFEIVFNPIIELRNIISLVWLIASGLLWLWRDLLMLVSWSTSVYLEFHYDSDVANGEYARYRESGGLSWSSRFRWYT